MSGIISASAIALATLVTVLAATIPDISGAISPVFDVNNEFVTGSLGLMISIPGLALLTLIAGAARE